MPGPLLIDLSHTSHSRARTGIQRTARALAREWGHSALAVCHDPYERAWRPLEPWELRDLADNAPGASRRARWPLAARLRGLMRRRAHRPDPIAAATAGAEPSGFLTPEIFSPEVAAALEEGRPRVRGPRAALFYDAVALRHPELSPSQTVARFPGYLLELTVFDGVAAISEDSREALVSYWRWLGVAHPPPVVAIPLGIDPGPQAPALSSPTPPTPPPAGDALPMILSVGTLEGRKNHVALLDACERLWNRGARFELRMIGAAHAQTGRAALGRVRGLRASGRPLLYDGPAGDWALEAAYARCRFTVYPSLFEGFGLPVAESLIRGKPCVCSSRGALGEITVGGGCVGLDEMTPDSIAAAIDRLLSSPSELAALTEAARGRRFRSSSHYARAVADWMDGLRPAADSKTFALHSSRPDT